MCIEITYPFPNVNGYTVEIWEWIRNFMPGDTGCVITYPCREKVEGLILYICHCRAVSNIVL